MGATLLTSNEIGNVQRSDFDITTTGQAIITKVIAGTNITISSSGVDSGTGDVTINCTNTAGNLTGPITSVGLATNVASQTGTGSKFVMDSSPTLTGTPLAPTAVLGTNTTQIATTAFVLANSEQLLEETNIAQLLGSTWKAQSSFTPLLFCGTAVAISTAANPKIQFQPVWLEQSSTLTGIKVLCRTNGSITANNENRIGLYTYSAGTLTLVASSTNNSALWTSMSANVVYTIAFSSTYVATSGMYFIGLLVSNSAQTTAPQLAGLASNLNTAFMTMDFTSSAKLCSTSITGVATLPTTYAMSSTTASSQSVWFALY